MIFMLIVIIILNIYHAGWSASFVFTQRLLDWKIVTFDFCLGVGKRVQRPQNDGNEEEEKEADVIFNAQKKKKKEKKATGAEKKSKGSSNKTTIVVAAPEG